MGRVLFSSADPEKTSTSIGYYAKGFKVTYVIMFIVSRSDHKPEIFDLFTFDLSFPIQRVQNIIVLIRLSSLLLPLANLIGERTQPEFIKIQRYVTNIASSLVLIRVDC